MQKTQPQIKDKPDVVSKERRQKLMKLLGRELTTDEVIRFVRDFAIQTCRRKDCRDCLYIDMALTLADEVENNRRAAPENKPLTLDELRGMDGEPVWVGEKDQRSHIGKCGLIDVLGKRIVFNRSTYVSIRAVAGKRVFARRPEDATEGT